MESNENEFSQEELQAELEGDEGWEHVGTTTLHFEMNKTIVFSMRLPRELVQEITNMSQERGMKPTVFARQALELGMVMEDDASLDVVATVLQKVVKAASRDNKSA